MGTGARRTFRESPGAAPASVTTDEDDPGGLFILSPQIIFISIN